MKHLPLLAAAAALVALSGCSNSTSNTTNVAAAEPQVAAPAEMPPPITAQKTYRCKDSSLVYVAYQGETAAQLHDGSKDAPIVQLKSEGAGKPFKAEGYSVSGQAATVTIERPGKGSQSCKS